MSAENIAEPRVPELYADPHCRECIGTGRVAGDGILCPGYRWCHCAKVNHERRIELDEGSAAE